VGLEGGEWFPIPLARGPHRSPLTPEPGDEQEMMMMRLNTDSNNLQGGRAGISGHIPPLLPLLRFLGSAEQHVDVDALRSNSEEEGLSDADETRRGLSRQPSRRSCSKRGSLKDKVLGLVGTCHWGLFGHFADDGKWIAIRLRRVDPFIIEKCTLSISEDESDDLTQLGSSCSPICRRRRNVEKPPSDMFPPGPKLCP